MFKMIFPALVLGCLLIPAPAAAYCDKDEAREVIKMVEQHFASREDSPDSAVVWYHYRSGWERLTREQKYSFVEGLGSVEHCLTGKAIRIRVAGEDVARKSVTGTVELYD